MAKITGALKIKGKLKSADAVFVERLSGIYMRSLPKVVTEKSAAFKEHSGSAGSVSKLAGEVNRLFRKIAPTDTGVRMYVHLLKRFRKVPSHLRLLRLSSIVGMDVHATKTIQKIGLVAGIDMKKEGRQFSASLDHSHHPSLSTTQHFYRLEIIVAQWAAEARDPGVTEQHTKWIYPQDKLKKYEFEFDLSDDCVDYLVMLSCRLAERKELNLFPPDNIVQVVDAGSFDEDAVAELRKYYAAKKEIQTMPEEEWGFEDDGVEGVEKE